MASVNRNTDSVAMVVVTTVLVLLMCTVQVHGQVTCAPLTGNSNRPGRGQCCRYISPSNNQCSSGSGGQCWACAPGTFVNSSGSNGVTPSTNRCDLTGDPPLVNGTYRCFYSCALGRYQFATGASLCLACEVGRFQNVTGQTFCFNCSAGRGSATAQSICSDCVANTYSIATQPGCVNCSAGSSTFGLTGQTGCTMCVNDTFSVAGGNCVACAAGSFS